MLFHQGPLAELGTFQVDVPSLNVPIECKIKDLAQGLIRDPGTLVEWSEVCDGAKLFNLRIHLQLTLAAYEFKNSGPYGLTPINQSPVQVYQVLGRRGGEHDLLHDFRSVDVR